MEALYVMGLRSQATLMKHSYSQADIPLMETQYNHPHDSISPFP